MKRSNVRQSQLLRPSQVYCLAEYPIKGRGGIRPALRPYLGYTEAVHSDLRPLLRLRRGNCHADFLYQAEAGFVLPCGLILHQLRQYNLPCGLSGKQ